MAVGFVDELGVIEAKSRPARMGRNPAATEAPQSKASKKISSRRRISGVLQTWGAERALLGTPIIRQRLALQLACAHAASPVPLPQTRL
jgi:hypothetical protein